jgi:hypothetical protein
MPLSRGNGAGGIVGGQSVRVAGCYASLLRREKALCETPDPRGTVGLDVPPASLQAAPSARYAALLTGKPVTVKAWQALPSNEFGGIRQEIPWLDGSDLVQVSADDTIREASTWR